MTDLTTLLPDLVTKSNRQLFPDQQQCIFRYRYLLLYITNYTGAVFYLRFIRIKAIYINETT